MRIAAFVVSAVLLLPLPVAVRAQDSAGIRAFSRYDFVPGERTIRFDDFLQDAIGDFPAGWNTNAAAEVVTIDGKEGRWLALTRGGVFVPDLTGPLPDNFTLEFDVLASQPFTEGTSLATVLAQLEDVRQPQHWNLAENRFTVTLHPSGEAGADRRQAAEGEPVVTVQAEAWGGRNGGVAHVSIWRQRERLRVYVNESKVWDVPKAMTPGVAYNAIVFSVHEVEPQGQYYMTNVRLAVGAPDTRNKLLTDGRWTTSGIRFDVNSDRIRGESYGTLKEIAAVLKENATLRVRIVGHTDADGDDAANIDLSRRRAAAVKAVLTSEFGIDAARMETDGKGEAEPAAGNDTAAGKAANRRVEFVKL
jgi:outer membrane protein OmpA-like peptidoglycan-associated protein